MDIRKLYNKPLTISEKFHEKTKIRKFTDSLDESEWPKSWKTIYYKGYSRLKEIQLPKPGYLKMEFSNVLLNRRSERSFSKKPLLVKQLSDLLFNSAGLKRIIDDHNGVQRLYPSAGARYPLEIYIITLNTPLPQRIYHYYVKNHSLEELYPYKKREILSCINQKQFREAAAVIAITAAFKRTTIKYGDRGYRYVLIEAGHLGQNLYLVSSALGLSCCAIGGVLENKLNILLDIDGLNESVIYTFAVGRK